MALSLAFNGGCGTVSQKSVTPATAGFYVAPVKVANGYLVDAAFRDRFNALISVYGNKKFADGAPVFLPALRKDQGLTELGAGQWLMSFDAMENMIVLSDLKRRAAPP